MTKFKAVIHVEVVYDVDLSYYDTDDLEEALEVDRSNIDYDPFSFLGMYDAEWNTTVEMIEE